MAPPRVADHVVDVDVVGVVGVDFDGDVDVELDALTLTPGASVLAPSTRAGHLHVAVKVHVQVDDHHQLNDNVPSRLRRAPSIVPGAHLP